MSTFPGLVEEIPGISIDSFDEDNLNSSVFFLSHCHQDHMRGLNYDFFNHLECKNQYLYCSHLSKAFLKSSFSKCKFEILEKHIIDLGLNESRIVEYIYNDNVLTLTVSFISSGHCPGSVMFLFKFNSKNILYTGDFRINKQDFSKLQSLHFSDTVPLNLDKIYLDTTFLSLDFFKFPSRLNSSKELCTIVKDWLEKDTKNIIILEISALYGSEFIYIELFKLLSKKIHVKDKIYDVYNRIEILADCVTNVGENSAIHACMNKKDSIKNMPLKCRLDVRAENILTVVPSVQKWAGKDTDKVIEWDSIRKQTINVCYSTHASYDELSTFIQYFKPKDVFPCVCNEKDEKVIYELLDRIMKKNQKVELREESCALNISKYRMSNLSDFKSELFSSDEED